MSDPLRAPAEGSRAPMRTLQVGMEWFAEKPGGLNRMYYELTRHLPAVNVQVHGLVAGTDGVARDSHGTIEAFAPISAGLVPRLLGVRHLARPILRADPGLLVVSHFALYTAPLLPMLGGHRLVIHFQGPWGMEGRAERQSAFTEFAKTVVERAVYRRAAACIVLSTPFARVLETGFGVPRERIHVIPGGVDVPRFAIAQSRAECRDLLGWPKGRPVVLAVRRLAHRMGLDDLVSAAALVRERLPDVLVLIAGSGPIAGDLERRIAALDLADNVRLLGFVPDAVLPQAYRAADLTVVPSRALEGFGLIVAESLAAGTPCLVTPVGGLPEAVAGLSRDLILGAAGAEAIAQGLTGALTGMLPLPDARACAEFARRCYDWPVIAGQIRRVYDAALR